MRTGEGGSKFCILGVAILPNAIEMIVDFSTPTSFLNSIISTSLGCNINRFLFNSISLFGPSSKGVRYMP